MAVTDRIAPARKPRSSVDLATTKPGTPGGICTMDSRESRPSNRANGTGTPITGSGVAAATMPGRWAAPPAPAMITSMPRSAAPRA